LCSMLFRIVIPIFVIGALSPPSFLSIHLTCFLVS
jgi:hypothetical protein